MIRLPKSALRAALAGLASGSLFITGCPGPQDDAAMEKNACNGPNGCGAESKKDEQTKDANGCNAHDGCNAKESKPESPTGK
ncbi:MAG: hypothetical protein H6834_15605 [Planctomycetes bacterium]|nr:hypothetical protein [Planctomycetota bacterium]